VKTILLIAALACGPLFANELDNDSSTDQQKKVKVTQTQVKAAKRLPATVVVRVKRTDLKNPNAQFEVAYVRHRLPAGKKVKNGALSFEGMQLQHKKRGLAYNSENELDETTSTDSWGFNYGDGAPQFMTYSGISASIGYVPPYADDGAAAQYPLYAYNAACAGGCGGTTAYALSPFFYPRFAFAGYNYTYSPYYSYFAGDYLYSYCGWPYYNVY
jgi:hypothetical protein